MRAIVNAAAGIALLFAFAAQAVAPPKVIVLGDSLTAGYGLEAGQSFPAQLQTALDDRIIPVQIVNAGVSGDTTAGGLARLDWVLKDDPDAVIVELGANDGLRGLDPRETYANLDAIITRLQEAKIRVLLAGMKAPPNLGKDYAAEFDAVYPQLAKAHDILLYPFFLDGVAGDRELTQADGLHPTAKGIARIVTRIQPYVLELLGMSP